MLIKALKPIPFKSKLILKPCKTPFIFILINLLYKFKIFFLFLFKFKLIDNWLFWIKKYVLSINFKDNEPKDVSKKRIFFIDEIFISLGIRKILSIKKNVHYLTNFLKKLYFFV